MTSNEQAAERGKGVLRQFEKLKAIRDPLDKDYEDCYSYTYPSLGVGFRTSDSSDGISNAQTARAKQSRLFDTTAAESARLLSSSLISSLTPSNLRWFDLAPPMQDAGELEADAREWLEDSAERVHTAIHSSNYGTEALEFMMHETIAGMAGLYIELKNNRLHFETWPLNHLYCQETLNEGYVDTVYRQLQYTVGEAVVEFGLESLPEHMRESFKNNPYDTKTHRFVVAIRPRLRNGKQSAGKTSKNMPWESIWVSSCGTIVRERGFNEMPVIVPRWLKIPDTDYARSPVFDALPDIKTLNKVKENMLQNMDLHITGMFKVKDDGVVNPANIKFGARRVIPVGDMENLQPLSSGGDIQFAMNEIQSLQGSIRRMLLSDQLGPTEKAIQTATEVQTRNNQVRQILGPIFARFESEFLSRMVERCFSLLARAGLLEPFPESLAGKELQIDYRSPLARSQKMVELDSVDKYMQRMMNLAQIKPEALDFMDVDGLAKEYAELLGVDPDVTRDGSEVKKLRFERERKQQAAQQAQAAIAMAQSQAQQPGAAQNPMQLSLETQ